MLDGLQKRFQPVDNRLERRVVHQHFVFGVVHDVDQVFIEQPDIYGVDDPAKTDRAIPCGEVTVVVHCKSRNAVTFLQAHSGKSLRQFPRFARDPGPVAAFNAAVGPARHDLARAMFARRIVDQMGDP